MENNISKIGIKYAIWVLVLFLIAVFFLLYQKKNIYYKNIIYKENNLVYVLIDYQNIKKLFNNNELYLNDILYKYQIREFMLDTELHLYKVGLNLDKDLINNSEYKIFINKESYLNYLIKEIGGSYV